MAPKFDLSTPKGVLGFNGYMTARSYVEGYAYSKADADMFAACPSSPDKATAPHAYRWFIHIAAIIGVRSLNFSGATTAPAAPAPAPAAAASKKAAPKAKAKCDDDGDDDDDDLFGDDEEEAPASKPEKSRADIMKEAKAAKDAKKKIDRSQIVLEVKPWEADTDLNELFKMISKVVIDGLVWGEAYKLVPVAFGVKKLVLSCVVEDSKVGVEDITDAIEAFDEYVQSVDMTTMNRL
ncbi:unnamed protein product [Choristocarpus tenellus]